MFRTVFALGLCAVLGVLALKLVFGLFTGVLGGAFAIFFWLLGLALRIALVGLVLYVILRIANPRLARRVRERFESAF